MAEHRSEAFTLMEMLTVVAVLGILTAMLTTSLSAAKSKAVGVQCQSNLRQYGIALNSFVGAHSVYPLAINPVSSGYMSEHGGMFFRSLRDEGLGPLPSEFPCKKPSVYLCPSAQRIPTHPRIGGELAFYGYNVLGLQGDRDAPLGLGFRSAEELLSPVPESAIRSPSRMIALGEGVRGWQECYQDGNWVLGRLSSTTELFGSTARVRKRHSGKANVVFCDGHVEACTLKFLFADESDAALACWNRDHQPHRERLE